jgi:hypothetical protein
MRVVALLALTMATFACSSTEAICDVPRLTVTPSTISRGDEVSITSDQDFVCGKGSDALYHIPQGVTEVHLRLAPWIAPSPPWYIDPEIGDSFDFDVGAVTPAQALNVILRIPPSVSPGTYIVFLEEETGIRSGPIRLSA